MTDRDISGEIRRSSLSQLPALLGVDGDGLKEVAERVRQFDKSQSDDTRQRKALEKISQQIGQSILMENVTERSRREEFRRREIEAMELMAVAQVATVTQMNQIRDSRIYKVMAARLGVMTDPQTEE